MPKKVLIITYYWPPSGGAGVQRWLKFVKYLPQFGWEPIIYTVKNGEYPVLDPALIKEIPDSVKILKQPIWEPYSWYKKLTGLKKEDKINSGFLTEKKKPRILEKLSVWIRGNLFIPDARKFWIKPSIKYLDEFLHQNKIDVLISSGPPHSMHLIALGLKKNHMLPWIADFRDPWTNIDYFKDLKLTSRSYRKHQRLEKEVLMKSDTTLTIGGTLGTELRQLGSENLEVIENGFDPDDINIDQVDLDQKFSVAHIGSFTPSRNHKILWKVIEQLINENQEFSKNFQLKLVGKVDYSVKQSIHEYGLNNHVRFISYLPHSEVINEQCRSHVLLLLVNDTPNAKGIITGKVFEYIASGRPIIVIGPEDGDVAEIVNESNSGSICDFNDEVKLKSVILDIFNNKIKFDPKVERYSRILLTKKLSNLLNSISERSLIN